MKKIKFLDVTRPGKGVERKKSQAGIGNFFELYFRKFGSYCLLNIITFLFSIPLVLVLMMYAPSIMEENRALYKYEILMTCYYSVIGFQIIMPGTIYVVTRFVNEKHSWVFSDFLKKIKENFKQSFMLLVFDVLVMIFLFEMLNAYKSGLVNVPELWSLISKSVLYSCCVIFYIMHFYIYQIMVFYDLKFFEILKKSLMFTFISLPLNILAVIISIVLSAACFFMNSAIGSLLFIFIIPIIITFLVNYCSAQTINRFMKRDEE